MKKLFKNYIGTKGKLASKWDFNNAEVWYGLTKKDTEDLEALDKSLIRQILKAQHMLKPFIWNLGVCPLK